MRAEVEAVAAGRAGDGASVDAEHGRGVAKRVIARESGVARVGGVHAHPSTLEVRLRVTPTVRLDLKLAAPDEEGVAPRHGRRAARCYRTERPTRRKVRRQAARGLHHKSSHPRVAIRGVRRGHRASRLLRRPSAARRSRRHDGRVRVPGLFRVPAVLHVRPRPLPPRLGSRAQHGAGRSRPPRRPGSSPRVPDRPLASPRAHPITPPVPLPASPAQPSAQPGHPA